ncbi:DeoR/GlpR family DNA-binding transcription regulator [Pedobacter frigoris]|uniref:DeoR/GlpR transcriptional regulator n=1 Tax=Pedobacter frigoris TaxID=2571272 RepID=A0A4U1CHA1_9SPHI|nr:DeoR/GlpR family DNA-binding transcription regulator [Pedobacter frigoris]TKC06155.1 DeoR/GlpR transcriptional regulator [Pedobacter frigoris]
MIKEERKQQIIDHIGKEGKVLLGDLSKLLNVSEDTVRRDIKELSDEGLLKAVRGGAILHSPIPLHYREREHYDVGHKEIIAEKALKFIKNGLVIIFDAGTSALAVATKLPKELKITVITNSFPVANVLEDHPNAEVIFVGGRLNKSSFSTMGYEAIQTIKNVRADICFLGICSIDLNLGVTGLNYEDSQIKKTMVETSKQIIALSTFEKLNTAENYYICAANEINTIITDIDPDRSDLQHYKDAGIEII